MISRSGGHAAVLALCTLLGSTLAQPVAAQTRRTVIQSETVLRLELAEPIGTGSANRGQRVTATLSPDDRSGIPDGTRFEGVVTEVRQASDDRPALLDMEFRRAILPDGTSARIRADLASLAEDDIRQTDDGRLESRRHGNSFDWKWIGYGAAGGAVLGQILGDDFLKGTLLGGLGGAIYGYLNRDRDEHYREIRLDRGTEFGIRLKQDLAFAPSSRYRFAYRERPGRERVLGVRDEYRLDDARVSVDGHAVRFGDLRPMRVNGTTYVPLRPVAEAANWSLRHPRDADDFVLDIGGDLVRGGVGTSNVSRAGRNYRLDAAPMSIGGEIYVPLEYVSRVGRVRVDWDRGDRRSGRNLPDARQRVPDTRQLVEDLATFPYSDLKTSVSQWKRVDVDGLYSEEQQRLLDTVITGNSLARRNRNLLTNLLRQSELITNTQTVVGVSRGDRIIYVK